jgi:uncharacterized protein
VTDHETVQEIVKRLVQAAQPEQIILFGSGARDEAGEDSDVDLLVIESEPFGPERSRCRIPLRCNMDGLIPDPD